MIVLTALTFSGVWDHGRPAFPASIPLLQRQSPELQDRLIRAEVKKYLGVPYRKGGGTRKGMDCSGFVRKIYQEVFGINLPHHAGSQHALKTFQKVYPEQLSAGDLIFFTATKNKKRINHVGIYLGDGEFAHAARTSGVVISSLSNSHWKSRFFAAKRLSMENGTGQESIKKYADSLTRDADQEHSVRLGFAAREFLRPGSIIDASSFWQDSQGTAFGPELTYTQAMSDRLWAFRFGALREVYIPDRAVYIPGEIRPDPEMGIPAGISDIKYRDGLRFAGGVQVSDYLKITPSFTYFTADWYFDPAYQRQFSLAIDLGIGSCYYDWPISMDLNYAELQSSTSRLAPAGDESGIFDISVTYRHRLNDNFFLFFTGEYAERYQTLQQESNDPFTGNKQNEQEFSIELNITY